MKTTKRTRLEAQGWTVGSAKDFLQLNDEEAAFVELKLALSHSLKQWRTKTNLSQVQLAKRLKSSQSRVAKMEAGDPAVSVDLLVRSLLVMGATRQDIARAIA